MKLKNSALRILFSRPHRIIAFCALVASYNAWAPVGILAGVSDAGPDATLSLILRDISQNKLDVALARTENLLRMYPNFRLAHLIRGDLLLARAQPIANLGNLNDAPEENLRGLREEAIARFNGFQSRPQQQLVPRYLMQMRPDQNYAIVVDAQRSRLYLYRNDHGRPMFVADYYVSQGKEGAAKQREGDNKTPVGVYRVTSVMPRTKLTDFYGHRAFPISYPNEWDRLQGRNGHGIWLHGVPSDTYARPPKASEGCVVLANQDLDSLSTYLQIGMTPVIISEKVEWLSLDEWQKERQSLSQTIDAWRADLESGDITRYLQHYSTRFKADKMDLTAWAKTRRVTNSNNTGIKVSLRNTSMFRDPGQDEMVEVTFDQDYQSNTVKNVSSKRQYWVKEDGQWKIIYEGAA